MSPALSLFSRPFIRAIVLGDDMIPRLSLTNFDVLRDRVIECGCISAQKKFCLPLSTSNPVFRRESVPQSCRKILDDYRRAAGRQSSLGPGLVLPGRVLHLVRRESCADSLPCIFRWSCFCLFTLWCRKNTACCPKDELYDAKFVPTNSLGEIVVSMNMMYDHMPDVLEPAIRRALFRERANGYYAPSQ